MFMLWLLFQISINPSNQSWCRIHLLMLCIDGLSFFLLYHQTNNIFTVTECYLAFVEFHPQIVMWFIKYLWLHSPMYTFLVSTTNTIWIFILFIHMALLNNSMRDPSLETEKPTFFLKVVLLLPWDLTSTTCVHSEC